MKKIFIYIFILFICNLQCKKPCVGYRLYEIDEYYCSLIDKSDYNDITSNETVKYYYLSFNIFPQIHKIDEFLCSDIFDSINSLPVKEIKIFSNSNYNTEFFEGKDLSVLFLTKNKEYDTMTLKEYLINHQNEYRFYLFLKEKPDSSNLHTFFITVTMQDDTKYQFESIPIIITP